MHSFLNFLKKNKLYTAINITGLTVSMAFVLLLACYALPGDREDHGVCRSVLHGDTFRGLYGARDGRHR